MKKVIIGAIVGGIILFFWQFLSWTVLNLHESAYQYTDKQDTILAFLGRELGQEGQYFLPTTPSGSSMGEKEAQLATADGKPWAVISYHSAFKADMAITMLKSLLVNILVVGLFCYIISWFRISGIIRITRSALAVSLIVYLNGFYTNHIWYDTPGIMAHLIDSLISWILVGIFIGWLMSRKKESHQ